MIDRTDQLPEAARESEVRSYSREWPVQFAHARGARVQDVQGRSYLDFFAGAGTLNYGHNPPALKEALLSYVAGDGITHSLDLFTAARTELLTALQQHVLTPRGLDYRVMFPGPTGTNSVEAALKLARKVTGRSSVVAFTGAFHGMSLGSLSVTGSESKRAGAGVPLAGVHRMPYDGFAGGTVNGPALLDAMLRSGNSGLDRPAAVIVETVQGEGGVNVASPEWLAELSDVCRRHDMLLIVDDVQMGCGRTGPFFSFETAGIVPDIVCLSKALSGYGLPMSLTLFRSELDVWEPGEHNGTFRGHNLAFVTAAAALRSYWRDNALENWTAHRAGHVEERLREVALRHEGLGARVRGRGLVWGLEFRDPELARRVGRAAFTRGLLVETSGARDEVLKLLPPLTVSDAELDEGLEIVAESVTAAAKDRAPQEARTS
ncbi:diaminobutyrate--2-oxoglutarate transaminase [Streptomyces populi]|uniref:Diaminobutyrate--2-oxoglutarate transaminase n=1 Tax=Streptomyces populi TaxID=2058924 RepID=A0A2I0SHE0_9ACTN|nr:diaminobutyrate--2-oxoglutarate transaminase [Streptomyces populi]